MYPANVAQLPERPLLALTRDEQRQLVIASAGNIIGALVFAFVLVKVMRRA